MRRSGRACATSALLAACVACGGSERELPSPSMPLEQSAQRGSSRPSQGSDTKAGAPAQPEVSSQPSERPEGPDAASTEPSDKPAEPEPDPVARVLSLAGDHSTSMGSPDYGRLEGGVALPKSGPGFVHNERRPHEARFGTVEVVQAIIRAAAAVEEALPGSGLVVNDLSLREGGPIAQHGSHQNGRDADTLFYYLDQRGEPMPAVGVPLDPKGKGWDFKDLSTPEDDVRMRVDVPRTWKFLEALLDPRDSLVQRVFIVEHVRSMLLSHARGIGARPAVLRRFEQVTCQPGTPHDDHMHIRFYCSLQDLEEGCLDKFPLYPWRRRALRQAEMKPRMATGKRSKKRRRAVARRTTSPEEARRRAGPMHWKVRRFLDRREAWLPKPSPGRPWCQ